MGHQRLLITELLLSLNELMKKLRLGVVGCGDIARYTALVSKLVRQVSLVACCDVNVDRVREFAHRHRIPQVFDDYAKMLASTSLDAVYLAVPHDLHFQMIESAIDRGLPVFVEKPITRTYKEGVEISQLATKSGTKIGVNYQYRYDRGCYALARAVQQGALGKILSVRINIPWHRERSYFDESAWHKTVERAGGGTLITQGSHFLDAVLWALDGKPLSAVGYTASSGIDVEVEALAHAIIEMEDGGLVSITSSMVAASEDAVTIEMYGEQGTALYSDRPRPHVKFSGVKIRKESPPIWGVHALQRSLAGFANWILKDQSFLIPASEALPVLATVEAIYLSAQSGKREAVQIEH